MLKLENSCCSWDILDLVVWLALAAWGSGEALHGRWGCWQGLKHVEDWCRCSLSPGPWCRSDVHQREEFSVACIGVNICHCVDEQKFWKNNLIKRNCYPTFFVHKLPILCCWVMWFLVMAPWILPRQAMEQTPSSFMGTSCLSWWLISKSVPPNFLKHKISHATSIIYFSCLSKKNPSCKSHLYSTILFLNETNIRYILIFFKTIHKFFTFG